MAATAVLRSQDCLSQPHRFHNGTSRNTDFCPNPLRSRGRKRSSSGFVSVGRDESRNRNTDRMASNFSAKNLDMGQVKILKRGEPLPEKNKKQGNTTIAKKVGSAVRGDDDELLLCSTGRIGPDPETVQKQIRASDFYAGSGPTVASPPPSSLPFPALFAKKEKKNDPATSNLLRLLRLDLP